MPIVFRCKCLQKLSVSRKKAGTQVRCPKCQQLIQTPRLEPETESKPAGADPQQMLWVNEVVDSSPPTPAQLSAEPTGSLLPKIPQPTTGRSGAKPLVVVAICVGVVLSALGIVTLVIVANQNKDDPIADNRGAASDFLPWSTDGSGTIRSNEPAQTVAPSKVPTTEPPPRSVQSFHPSKKSKTPSFNPKNQNGIEKNIRRMLDPKSLFKEIISANRRASENDKWEQRFSNPDAIVHGIGKKIGINYFPADFGKIIYMNLATSPNPPQVPSFNKSFFAFLDRIQLITGVQRQEIQHVVRGTIGLDRHRFGNNYLQPSLVVVKTIDPIDLAKTEDQPELFKKHTILEHNYYRTPEGYYFAIPEKRTLVLGTRNEVIYALRFGASNQPNPKLEWVDYSKYIWLEVDVSVDKGSRRNGVATGFTEDSRVSIELQPSTQRAYDMAAERKKYINRVLAGRPMSNDPEEIARAARRQQAAQQQLKKSEFKIYNDGPRYIHLQRSREGQSVDVWTIARYSRINPIDSIPSTSKNNRQRLDNLKQGLIKFETYKFSNRQRQEFEERFTREYQLTKSIDRVSADERAIAVQFFLTQTSSNFIRSIVAKSFAESQFNETSLRVFGLEAQQFDLATAFMHYSKPEYDDYPADLIDESKSRDIQKQNGESLLKIARYYVRYGGDPVLSVAACRIIEDLKDTDSHQILSELVEDTSRMNEVRAAAKRALEYIYKTEPAPNSVPQPRDASQVVEWLGDLNRAKRAGAIQWLGANQVDDETRPKVIEKLVYLVDDSLLHRDAMALIKKMAASKDMIYLRKVIENATQPKVSKFRTRQHHSLHRIVDLLGYFKDIDGIALCAKIPNPGYTLNKRIAPLLKALAVDLDEIIDELLAQCDGSRADSDRFLRLSNYNFTDKQKTKIRTWLANYVNTGKSSSRLWGLLEKCDPYHKKMVPTLIKLLVHRSFVSHRSIKKYLAKYETSIEEMVISELNQVSDKNRVRLEAIDLLGEIGTDKSLVILRQFQGGGQLAEAAFFAVKKIRQAKRQPRSFDTFPEPN